MKIFPLRLPLQQYFGFGSDETNRNTEVIVSSVEDQALSWFLMTLSDRLTKSEQTKFEDWVNADSDHRLAYYGWQSLWHELGKFADRPEICAERKNARLDS